MQDATWSEIDYLSTHGFAQNYFSIHEEKDITVLSENVTMEIIGFNHDDLSTGGKAGITFGMSDLMAQRRQINSYTAYAPNFPETDMGVWLNGTLYNGIQSDLRSVIKSVKKNSRDIISDIKIFLFSCQEIVGYNEDASSVEGSRYAGFSSISDTRKRYANGTGDYDEWWTRSHDVLSTNHAKYSTVRAEGTTEPFLFNAIDVDEELCVCFGFCV